MKITLGVLFTLFLSASAVAAPCATGGGSRLQVAANGLEPGEWCEVNLGLTADHLRRCTSSYLEYQGNGYWDPVNRIAGFIGAAHQEPVSTCSEMAHVYWRDGVDSWTEDAPTTPNNPTSGPQHGNDQTVVDPSTGYVYFVSGRTSNLYRGIWNGSGYTWDTSRADYPTYCQPTDRETVATGWDNTPGHVGIVTFTDEGDGTSCFWDRDTNSWSVEGTNLGDYQVLGGYDQCVVCSDPADACWLLPYGTTAHRKATRGTVTSFPSAPTTLGCTGGASAGVTDVDPESGKFITSQPPYNVWREFDITHGTFATIGHSMPPLDSNGGASETNTTMSISTYGVILFLEFNDGNPKTYLYKHSPSTGDHVSPSAPSNLEIH